MSSRLMNNAISGFTIFLIALPLSVGISIASGAPPSAGLLSAMIGGIIGSLLGGSALTINGPAAGLIVVVISSIQSLGGGDPVLGFKRTLAATVVAGLLQVLFGVFRFGRYCMSVPTSVLHGMMAAIGISIISKQFHVAMGVAPQSKDIISLLAEIPTSFSHFHTEVMLVSALAFIILLSFDRLPQKWSRFFPAPLAVVIMGMWMAKTFDFEHEHMLASHHLELITGPKFLLKIPENLSSLFNFPDFSQILSFDFIHAVLTISLVASIESLLSAVAIDHLDPLKRTSNLDKELVSKGICNSALGLIGGLPIIAEIVRSTANLKNGATDRSSNFFHGAFIALFVFLFPALLNQIPTGALAAVLIMVGFKLAKPSQLFHLAHIGKNHAFAFLTTMTVTLFTDLLIGVMAGLTVEILSVWMQNKSIRELVGTEFEVLNHDAYVEVKVLSPMVFLNWVSLSKLIERIDDGKKLTLNLTASPLIDHSVIEQLERLKENPRLIVQVIFSESHEPVTSHPLATRVKRVS